MEPHPLSAAPTRRRRRRVVAAVLLLLAVAACGVVAWRAMRGAGEGTSLLPSLAGEDEVRAPEGQRVRVEVLNTTRTRGLARRATRLLRDRGFDVVAIGTTADGLDSTLVLDRTNHPEWARLVAEALGGARVEARPDTSRYLDVTVLLGASWRPPAEPFHP